MFLVLYLSSIVILVIPFPSVPNLEIFAPWKTLVPSDIIKLGASILMIFFLPGYALVVSVFDLNNRLEPLLKFLLGYLLSMFIAGTTFYSASILGFSITEAGLILILIYSAIVIIFILKRLLASAIRKNITPLSVTMHLSLIPVFLKKYIWHFIVYSGIFGLIFLATYSLYGGVIIGDQWFHHGRALLFLTGTFQDFFESNAEDNYPPFLPALLSSLFFLANIPSVNAYASIAFLNMIPAVAYYFFFIQWVPPGKKRATLLASALLVVGSGLGWMEALDMSISHPSTDVRGALLNIYTVSKMTYDIRTPSSFFLTSHPDFSTPLRLIALPAGFTLLGIIKNDSYNSFGRNKKVTLSVILVLITMLGIFSHEEFYIFVIIACIVPILFSLRNKSIIYLSIFSSISIILLFDTISPTSYFTSTSIFGIPLIILVLLFVTVTGFIYVTGVFRLTIIIFKHLLSSRKLHRSVMYYITLVLIIRYSLLVYNWIASFARSLLYNLLWLQKVKKMISLGLDIL